MSIRGGRGEGGRGGQGAYSEAGIRFLDGERGCGRKRGEGGYRDLAASRKKDGVLGKSRRLLQGRIRGRGMRAANWCCWKKGDTPRHGSEL